MHAFEGNLPGSALGERLRRAIAPTVMCVMFARSCGLGLEIFLRPHARQTSPSLELL